MANDQSDLDVIEEFKTHNAGTDGKAHPWRICPIGKHYVRTHVLHIPSSKEHPEGQIVTRHDHCADNPSHLDMMYKGVLKGIIENKNPDPKNEMPKFRVFYKMLLEA